ncbi:MAG TPA: amidohydrolase family protein [Pyrinomonadaceae bacterium]
MTTLPKEFGFAARAGVAAKTRALVAASLAVVAAGCLCACLFAFDGGRAARSDAPEEGSGASAADTAGGALAFVGVNVVPMDRERVLTDQTVVVKGGRVAEVGPANRVRVPGGSLVVRAPGKYLLPGLTDAHVHLRDYAEPQMEALLRLYIARGVTTVLNLSGTPRHLEMRARVGRGELFGPTIYTSGPFVSDRTGSSPTPEEVERAVAEQKRAGYDVIKIHGDFTREAYARLFVAARRAGLRVVGHSPRNLGPEVMSEERQDVVAHAEEYIYDRNNSSRDFAKVEARIPELARATARAGTWLIPNLTAYRNIGLQATDIEGVVRRPEMKYLPPDIAASWGPATNPYYARLKDLPAEGFWARYRVLEKLTKGFHDAGVRLLTGTDAMNPAVVPGFSLHDELRDLVAAGLTPYEALRAATANPGEFLGGGDFGTVAAGKRADLVLLDANPLADVNNASRIAGVVLRGRWLPAAELGKMIGEVGSRQ